MHWRAKFGIPVEINVELSAQDGLGWFWLSRQAGQVEEELGRPTVNDAVSGASYLITPTQVTRWLEDEVYLILSVQGGFGADVPIMLNVKQADATLELRDVFSETLNKRGGVFKPFQFGTVSAAKSKIILFSLRFES